MRDLNDAGLAQRLATLSDMLRDAQVMEQEALVAATKAEKALNLARGVKCFLQETMSQIRAEQSRRAQT